MNRITPETTARLGKRRVLTFYEDCEWHDPVSGGNDYNSSSILRGYRRLNDVVNGLAQHITVHAVSYSHVVFPSPGDVTVVRLFATVVYTGPSALGIYGSKNPYGPGDIMADTTILEVASL